eukprot:GHVU01150960.1.p3 GENE.GHVU01150960.1~~GHVU01150960.1.p3  ORF type:complete len:157 (+),score=13.84 GHVU01150960.1:53-523(+)
MHNGLEEKAKRGWKIWRYRPLAGVLSDIFPVTLPPFIVAPPSLRPGSPSPCVLALPSLLVGCWHRCWQRCCSGSTLKSEVVGCWNGQANEYMELHEGANAVPVCFPRTSWNDGGSGDILPGGCGADSPSILVIDPGPPLEEKPKGREEKTNCNTFA